MRKWSTVYEFYNTHNTNPTYLLNNQTSFQANMVFHSIITQTHDMKVHGHSDTKEKDNSRETINIQYVYCYELVTKKLDS